MALPTRLAAAAYMGMFVAGTVAAMGSYTAFIGAAQLAHTDQEAWVRPVGVVECTLDLVSEAGGE